MRGAGLQQVQAPKPTAWEQAMRACSLCMGGEIQHRFGKNVPAPQLLPTEVPKNFLLTT